MKKYVNIMVTSSVFLGLVFGIFWIPSNAFEYTNSDGESSNNMYVTFDNVKYCQTQARNMLSLINEFRTGSEAWAYDVNNNKVYYDDLSEYTYDYNLEKVAMNRAAELILLFGHTSIGKQLKYWSQSDSESYACVEYNGDAYYVITFGDERRADLTGKTTTYGTDIRSVI